MKHFEVNKRNKDKLKGLLESDKPFIILYHWKECGHCIAFKPTWKKFAGKTLVQCCCIEYSMIEMMPAKLQNVRAFPTILVIRKGNIVDNYMGDRSEDSLNKFAEKYADKKK